MDTMELDLNTPPAVWSVSSRSVSQECVSVSDLEIVSYQYQSLTFTIVYLTCYLILQKDMKVLKLLKLRFDGLAI